MSRTKKAAAVALAAGLLFTSCSSDEEPVATGGNNEASSGTSAPAATSAPKETTTTTIDTSNDEELAKGALIGTSDLPSGEWSTGDITSSSGGTESGGSDFLDVPSCEALVSDTAAIKAESSGKASVEFTQGADSQVNLMNEVELWPSADTVEQIGNITDSADFAKCMSDAMAQEMSGDGASGVTPTDLKVTAFNVGIDADDVGVDFVTGVNLRFGIDVGGGMSGGGLVRFIFIGADRGLATVGITAFEVPGMTAPVDIESLDLAATARAAGRNLVEATKAS